MTASSPGAESPPLAETQFRLLVQNVADYAIYLIDPAGHVISWNPGAERIKGYRAEEVLGRHFSLFYRREDVLARKPQIELEVATEHGRYAEEGWRVRKGGELFWADVLLTAVHDERGELVGFAKITRDLTQQRLRDRERADRQRLFAASVRAQEGERRRIAWDVHDDSIQSMVAASMQLQLVAAQQPKPLRDKLTALDDSIQAAIGRLRGLVAHLLPPALERDDLQLVLRDYLDGVVDGWGLAHSLRYELPFRLPAELVVTTFRIVQEALVNVRKHAHAREVRVSVAEQDAGLFVRVVDDGRGMEERAAATVQGEHIGLVAMRERAEAAHGWLRVRGEPGTGVTVEFWLPAVRRQD